MEFCRKKFFTCCYVPLRDSNVFIYKKWIFAMHNLVYENNCTEKKIYCLKKKNIWWIFNEISVSKLLSFYKNTET